MIMAFRRKIHFKMAERSGDHEYFRAAVIFPNLWTILSDYFTCDIFLACGKNTSLHFAPVTSHSGFHSIFNLPGADPPETGLFIFGELNIRCLMFIF